MRRLLLRILAVIVTGAVLISIWAAVDLYIPHKVDICDFDPDEAARLDTAMWRSYYSRQRLKLYFELTELLEKQYKLNFWRRQAMAFRAAKAAFVFKDGESRADYEKALPDLEKFYAAIRDISTTDFDSEQADLRAEAMEIRDTKAEQGGVAEEDWARIDDLLHRSWRSLHHAVNQK